MSSSATDFRCACQIWNQPMLRKLAASYGVQTSYIDVDQKRVECNPNSILAVLRSLGAPLERIGDAGDALRARRLALTRSVLPPVIALWDDGVDGFQMTLPAELGSRSLEATLHLENGDVRDWSPSARTVLRAREVEDEKFITTALCGVDRRSSVLPDCASTSSVERIQSIPNINHVRRITLLSSDERYYARFQRGVREVPAAQLPRLLLRFRGFSWASVSPESVATSFLGATAR